MRRWLGFMMTLPFTACDLIYPKDLVYIDDTDRPIRSASFRTCGKDFPLSKVDSTFQARVYIPEGCDGTLEVVMAESDELSCRVAGISESGWRRRFTIRNDRCTGSIEIPLEEWRPHPGTTS